MNIPPSDSDWAKLDFLLEKNDDYKIKIRLYVGLALLLTLLIAFFILIFLEILGSLN
jgi:hypothetical protein